MLVAGKAPTPQICRGPGRAIEVQDLLGELRDGIEGAAVHLAGAMLLAE